jgi:hypothetical protein
MLGRDFDRCLPALFHAQDGLPGEDREPLPMSKERTDVVKNLGECIFEYTRI